jgi:hypothetical protein
MTLYFIYLSSDYLPGLQYQGCNRYLKVAFHFMYLHPFQIYWN